MPGTTQSRRSDAALAVGLTIAIVDLTLITAYIHFTLGGALFTLNALGYAGLAAAIVATAVPSSFLPRFAWLPRVGLAGYAAVTIAAYLFMGPYFTLGWIAKAVEIAIILLVATDLARLYGTPRGVFVSAARSFAAG
jgi:hypothetical protein